MPRTDQDRHNDVAGRIAKEIIQEAQEVSVCHGVVVLESVITAVLGTLFNSSRAATEMLDQCTEEAAKRLTEMFK